MSTTIESQISSTECAVLGLLIHGEQSGYDLLKLAQRTMRFFWMPARSQLYALLPTLVERGLASSRTVHQQGRPDKRLYSITPAGEEMLRAGLEQPTVASVSRDPFTLKLFFGDRRHAEDVRMEIEDRLRAAQERLRELEEIEKDLDVERHFFPSLALLDGIEQAKARIRFGKRALVLLDETVLDRDAGEDDVATDAVPLQR